VLEFDVLRNESNLWPSALVEKGISEFYVGGAAGFGKNVSATAGEVGVGADGIVGLSVGYSSAARASG
jgi:hypothetical protein